MRRVQHRQRHSKIFWFVGVLILALCMGCFTVYYFTKENRPHKVKVKHTAQKKRVDVIPGLNKTVFLKDNTTAVSINKQLIAADFSGTALVVDNDKVILHQGYGYANKKNSQPNDIHSLYQMASLQKSFTATLIMQQVEAKKLSMNTLLSNYYPNVPHAKQITIKQLLTMTSGLEQTSDNPKVTTEQDNVKYDAAHTKYTGSNQWSYQPINYRLLAGILMQITGKSYDKLFASVFNGKYQLDVVNYNEFLKNRHRTTGYYAINYSKRASDNDKAFGLETGTGNMAITASSLYQYYRSLIDGKILSSNNLTAMWNTVPNEIYASGLYHGGSYHLGHGIIRGFEPTVIFSLNGKFSVILLSNTYQKKKPWKVLAKKLFTQLTATKTQ